MLKVATEVIDIFYHVGSCYMTTDSTYNPNEKMGGTWEQITDDAYLKIVSSNGGALGGTSSEHKIPIESMPAHSHSIYSNDGLRNSDTGSNWNYQGTNLGAMGRTTDKTGGGQAYYPYYLGIYLWHRTA